MQRLEKPNPTKRVHLVGTSYVITLDKSHVERLKLDGHSCFFEQVPSDDGIVLRIRRLA